MQKTTKNVEKSNCNLPTNKLTNWPTNWLINQPTNQPSNQPTNQLTDQQIKKVLELRARNKKPTCDNNASFSADWLGYNRHNLD